MNLPNKLTISRIILTFIFIFLIKTNGLFSKSAAVAVFAIACMTDWVDGYLARKKKEVTVFGKLMDPIADKVLVISAFVAFSQLGLVAVWMVAIILVREFIVTGLRIFALAKGKVIAAHPLGKHKTVSSYIAIFLIMGFLIFKEIAGNMNFYSATFDKIGIGTIYIFMLVVILFTIISGANYIIRNAFLLRELKTEE
ncbi:MAG: CDP-diacylglycerol--glycerol-3-phosphate 3-phosphatidyltransferase [Candidatus Omnitrophota bacterium]